MNWIYFKKVNGIEIWILIKWSQYIATIYGSAFKNWNKERYGFRILSEAMEKSSTLFLPNRENRSTMFLFLKLFGFTTVFLLSLFIYRPFCKYFCPFGVFLGFFNKLSPLRYQIDASCNKCGLCKRKCKMGLVPFESPNNMECIRCGQCLHTCRRKALKKKQDVL